MQHDSLSPQNVPPEWGVVSLASLSVSAPGCSVAERGAAAEGVRASVSVSLFLGVFFLSGTSMFVVGKHFTFLLVVV